MLENSVPSKVFEVNNLSNGDGGFIYVGKTALVKNTDGNKIITSGNNCLSTFLMGGITPGRNIRIDKPTEKDPNLFLDAKFFDFQAYSPLVTGSCLLGKTKDTSGDVSYYFRPIQNDGSTTTFSWMIIESDDQSFYVGYDGITYYKYIDSSGNVSYSTSPASVNPNTLILKTHKLEITNSHPFMPSLFTHKDVDEYGNTKFYLNKLIAGPGITIKDSGDTLQLNFDYSKERPIPCCDSNYSGAGIDDFVTSSSSFEKKTCSDTANVYLMGYDFKNNVILNNVQCEGGFCNWSLDAYTFTVTSAPHDFNSSSSSSSSQSSSSTSSNSSSSQSELQGKAIVEIKNLFTEDDPNSPFIPNGTYYLEYTAHNFWESPPDLLNPNAPYISIEYVETNSGWVWKSTYGSGYKNKCGDGCSPNTCTNVVTPLDKENIRTYFIDPSSTFSFNSLSYKCGSSLFIRGMVVHYINGGDFVWDASSSSSSSSYSSNSESSQSSQLTSVTSFSNSSHSSHSSSSSSYMEDIAPYYVRKGWYYRLKSEETTDGYFMWNLRVMKYTTYYRDCLDDESSDYYRDFNRDFDQQERKVVRQDTELIVLTHASSGSFDLFTRNNVLQPSGKFLYNEELTKDWIELTTPPIYAEADPERIEHNVAELFLDGPHYTSNENTYADITDAWTDCGPYVQSSSSSLSDSESMGPMVSESSNSSLSQNSNSSSSSDSSSSSSESSNSSSSSSSSSDSSISSYSGSMSSMSS